MCWVSVFDGSWVAKYVIFVGMDFGDWLEREARAGWQKKKNLMGGSCLDLIMNLWGRVDGGGGGGVTCPLLVRVLQFHSVKL